MYLELEQLFVYQIIKIYKKKPILNSFFYTSTNNPHMDLFRFIAVKVEIKTI